MINQKSSKGFLLFLLYVLSVSCYAKETSGHGDDYSGDFWSRTTLTGDWGGIRNGLFEKGVKFDFDATHSTQHVASGGYEGPIFQRIFPDRHETESGALFNMLLNIDTGKLGLWPGGFLRVRGEGRVGQPVGLRSGSLMPTNGDALSPTVPGHAGEKVLALTELTYAQFLSEQFGVALGLFNTMEGDGNEFAGSLRSREHFMNTAMRFSPVVISTVPVTTLGAMAIFIPTKNIIGKMGFVNSEESAGYDPFDRDDGTTFLTEWTIKYQLAGLPGAQTFGFTYGFDRDRIDIGSDPRFHFLSLITSQTAVKTNEDTWALFYNGSQFIQGDEKGGWGVFLRGGVSDGNPSPIKWHTAFGLGGIGIGEFRPHDRWGIGGYALGASNEPLLNSLGIQDEVGFEAFYNAEITPWLHVTGDVQFVDSALKGVSLPLGKSIPGAKESWVFSLRTHWNF
ncbi:MAG: carbohydrate porin [Gammaproteobacteria bacterium]